MSKKVFILGAASDIAASIIEKLNSEGYEVHGSYNRTKPVAISEDKLIQMDLNDSESITKACEKLAAETYDGFVNCAGINIAGPLIGLEDADLKNQINVNLTGPMIVTKTIVKNMIRKRTGSIIHLGSVSAHRFFRGHSAYSASKAGIEGFVQAMASEVAKRGVRVNAILPGPVMSPMLQQSIDETGMDPKENIPTNKLVEGYEIANMCHFLLSEQCPSMTGALIPIDGGYLLW